MLIWALKAMSKAKWNTRRTFPLVERISCCYSCLYPIGQICPLQDYGCVKIHTNWLLKKKWKRKKRTFPNSNSIWISVSPISSVLVVVLLEDCDSNKVIYLFICWWSIFAFRKRILSFQRSAHQAWVGPDSGKRSSSQKRRKANKTQQATSGTW